MAPMERGVSIFGLVLVGLLMLGCSASSVDDDDDDETSSRCESLCEVVWDCDTSIDVNACNDQCELAFDVTSATAMRRSRNLPIAPTPGAGVATPWRPSAQAPSKTSRLFVTKSSTISMSAAKTTRAWTPSTTRASRSTDIATKARGRAPSAPTTQTATVEAETSASRAVGNDGPRVGVARRCRSHAHPGKTASR